MAEVIKINDITYRIEDGMVRLYLFIGTEKAALIDTGMNLPNAREIAEKLTDLPLILINTHSDRDHVSGNASFAEFYMNIKEEENYRANGGVGKILPIKEGDVIDLGNRPLKVIDIPGHTPGSIALLDEKNRILVSGDSVQDSNIYMFGPRRNPKAFVESLKHLKEYDGLYDDIYPMHGTFPVKPPLIDKLIGGVEEIIEGSAKGEEIDLFGNKVLLCKFDYAGFYVDIK